MSGFENLSNDKVKIMMRLLNSKELCKALHYTNPNFLDQPDIEDPCELIYKNIYPYRFIPQVNDTRSTYITLSFGSYKPVGTHFKTGIISFHAFTHLDLIRTDYDKLRYDFLIAEIDKLMNQQRGIGIGKMQFHEADELLVNENYVGMYVAYKLYE